MAGNIIVLYCGMMKKYKGKNIRVSDEAHQLAVEHCGEKVKIGQWTGEAIREKIERETIGEKARYNKNLTRKV